MTLGKEGAISRGVNKCLQDAGLARYVTRTGDHLVSEANENGTDCPAVKCGSVQNSGNVKAARPNAENVPDQNTEFFGTSNMIK